MFMESLSHGEDHVLRLSGSDQEGCCGAVSFPKLRLCPGMPTSMVSLSQRFHAACCSLASLARFVIYGEEFGVLSGRALFPETTLHLFGGGRSKGRD